MFLLGRETPRDQIERLGKVILFNSLMCLPFCLLFCLPFFLSFRFVLFSYLLLFLSFYSLFSSFFHQFLYKLISINLGRGGGGKNYIHPYAGGFFAVFRIRIMLLRMMDGDPGPVLDTDPT